MATTKIHPESNVQVSDVKAEKKEYSNVTADRYVIKFLLTSIWRHIFASAFMDIVSTFCAIHLMTRAGSSLHALELVGLRWMLTGQSGIGRRYKL